MNLSALNTKAIGYVGIIAFVIGLLTDTAFQSQLSALVGPKYQGIVSLIFTVAGFAAAYYGMPHTVPPAPAQGAAK